MEELEQENIKLKSDISDNEEKIHELDDKLKELSKKGIQVRHFPLNKNWKQVLEEKENELENLKATKENLIKCNNDQDKILKKQEEKIKNSSFSSRNPAFSRLPFAYKKSKIDVEFNEVQNQLINIESEIKRAKATLKSKKEHILQLKQFAEEIKVMKETIEQQDVTNEIDERRKNIQILKTRISDHQSFLENSPNKLKTEYKSITDLLIETRNRNSSAISDYSSKINSFLETQ